ncbi:DUF1778 domain-containing protein [Paramicrobacterium chengjingii]|uniref:type II toxin -antitoxin system TacA 1-like antitoxin n=1 Tax=Paramicrobacterium chengjingii TaxID=2769067 RepID=UPI003312FAE2
MVASTRSARDSAIDMLPPAALSRLPHSSTIAWVNESISCTHGALLSMAETLTIRLDVADRVVLEEAAQKQGKGLSAFVREIAEAQAQQICRDMIRADGERVVAHVTEHPDGRLECDELGTPLSDLA